MFFNLRICLPSPVDGVVWAGNGLAVTLGVVLGGVVGLGLGVGIRSAGENKDTLSD